MNRKDDEVYKVCPGCSKLIKWDAVICTYCGVQVQELKVDINYPKYIEHSYPVKSKAAAVVLAVFFSYWAWLYTYRINGGKFWTFLVVDILRSIFVILFSIPNANLGIYYYDQIFTSRNLAIFIVVSSLWTVLIWLDVLITSAIKPNSFYTNYPNG